MAAPPSCWVKVINVWLCEEESEQGVDGEWFQFLASAQVTS